MTMPPAAVVVVVVVVVVERWPLVVRLDGAWLVSWSPCRTTVDIPPSPVAYYHTVRMQ